MKSALRLLIAKVRSALQAELREDLAFTAAEEAVINVNKTYKPRRLKMDMPHMVARRLAKVKRKNPTYKRKLAVQRRKYMLKNGNGKMLKKRAQKVRDARKMRGLD